MKNQDIHTWFELSYAQYLTVPRSVLQSMPEEWQHKFTKLLNELDDTIDWRPSSGRYWVKLKDDHGRYVHDPLKEYRHASVKIKPRLIRDFFPKYLCDRIEKELHVSTVEDLQSLPDEKILSVSMFGKMKLQKLRQL